MNPMNSFDVEVSNGSTRIIDNNTTTTYMDGIRKRINLIASSIEPLDYFILYKDEVLSQSLIKNMVSEDYKRNNTILVYLIFIISFIVLYFYYNSQYTVSNSIFPLNEIEDGWSNCKPISTIVSYSYFLSSFLNNTSKVKQMELTAVTLYYDSIISCMSQLNIPQQICDPSNICCIPDGNGCDSTVTNGVPSPSGTINLCNGEILSPCNHDCNRNYVQFSFLTNTFITTVNDYSSYCYQNFNQTSINNACEQIYNAENPYNCSKKLYNGFLTSITLAFSSSLLVFHIAFRISVLVMKRAYKASKQ